MIARFPLARRTKFVAALSLLTAICLAPPTAPGNCFLVLASAQKHKKAPSGPPHASTPYVSANEWPAYGRDAGGERFSPLNQINLDNVKNLKVAWTFRTGDVSDGSKTLVASQFESTPIMVDGTLYLATPFDRVIALDPETGQQRWSYNPGLSLHVYYGDGLTCRGVSTWPDAKASLRPHGPRRIFIAVNDARLIALDAATGKPCPDFGDAGTVDLKSGIDASVPGEYHITSPPAVVGDLIIVGSSIDDNQRVSAPRGVVRAYNVITGALQWKWDPIPRDPSDPARSTWAGDSADKTGASNIWSIISADLDRGLVFLPGSSPSPDFYGGERKGDDLYANCVVALRAATGKVVWHFQVVHHDLWDYDIPAEPALITLRKDGRLIDSVLVSTKMGHVFVLDRDTGKPLFPVEERPVPQDVAEGEAASPTQPFPTFPAPLTPESLSAEEGFGFDKTDQDYCQNLIKSLHYEGIFTPPSTQGTIIYPGNIGGANWSGASFDPTRQIMVVNTNHLAMIVRLVPRSDFLEERKQHPHSEVSRMAETPYGMRRETLLTPSGTPCTPPPWGTLIAIDLASKNKLWEVPLGNPEPGPMNPKYDGKLGSVNLGGSIVTAGGLVFIAASHDNSIRAFDTQSGKVLWKADMPAGGQATPMTYLGKNGKQYVVICAGGHGRLHTTLGDYVIAYSLP
ncbi:MAG TPA: pyrroloquinoline quinone-dependent dehydrogenase [Blastocatellia bacterium]|nr:pyrroloquinoline quinone-dependent dehydrogenase [Blastocatellia bacterium]